MDFKSMLDKLSLLSEATKETPTGKVHKAEPGGYGRKFDPDEEGEEKKKEAPKVKRGRGRPKKGADSDTGEVPQYKGAKELQSFMVGNLPKKGLPGKASVKHSLKEWVQEVEAKYVKEAAPGQQLTVKPMPGAAQLVDPATQKVMATGDAAAVKNIQGAVSQGKVQMRGGAEEMAEGDTDYSAKKARAGKDIGKPGKQFAKIAKSAGEKYGSKERGEKVAGAVLAKLRSKVSEADIPTDQNDVGAGLGAGRSKTTLEAKEDKKAMHKDHKAEKAGKKVTKDMEKVEETAKPDYIDLDKDGNKKETMKKAADDKKKKKVNESVHKHTAARLLGKHHALAKEAYNCKYEDMEEAKMYHEGYKEGLDECYGQMPVQGLMSENPMPATTPGMASQAMPQAGAAPAMEEDMFDEGNAFTAALAKAEPGEKFTVGGKTFTDRSGYDADLDETFMAFEGWDKELNALLNEGMTVSISKGQQGSPDSVSVSAQDAEADQLLGLIKQAGLGLFGGEDKPEGFSPEVTGMSAGGEEEGRPSDDIGVVDDHDGMMALIKKVVGGQQEPEEVGAHSDHGHDYEGETSDEEHDHDHGHGEEEEVSEETCNECGMMESSCECESEQVEEVESYDQEEEEVAEANAPDSGAAETSADEDAEAKEDDALAKADELNEWANDAGQKGTDEAFNMDIAFITKAIAGGLNKEKATGQTTIPVIPGQNDRMGYSTTNESLRDWKKLAGLK